MSTVTTMPADSVSGRKDLFQLVVSGNLDYTGRPPWQPLIYSITWKKSQRLGITFKAYPQPHDLPVTLAPSCHLGANKCSKHDPAGNLQFQSAWHLPRVFPPGLSVFKSVPWGTLWQSLSHTSEVAWSAIFFVYIQGSVGLQLWWCRRPWTGEHMMSSNKSRCVRKMEAWDWERWEIFFNPIRSGC